MTEISYQIIAGKYTEVQLETQENESRCEVKNDFFDFETTFSIVNGTDIWKLMEVLMNHHSVSYNGDNISPYIRAGWLHSGRNSINC